MCVENKLFLIIKEMTLSIEFYSELIITEREEIAFPTSQGGCSPPGKRLEGIGKDRATPPGPGAIPQDSTFGR